MFIYRHGEWITRREEDILISAIVDAMAAKRTAEQAQFVAIFVHCIGLGELQASKLSERTQLSRPNDFVLC